MNTTAAARQIFNFCWMYFFRSHKVLRRLPLIVTASLMPCLSVADDMSSFAETLNANLKVHGYNIVVNSSDCRANFGNVFCLVEGVQNIKQIGVFPNPNRICFDNFDHFDVGYLLSDNSNIRSDCGDY